MYLNDVLTVDDLRTAYKSVVKKFQPATLEQTARIEWWASSFSDPGPDYNLFKAFNAKGQVIETVREEGY